MKVSLRFMCVILVVLAASLVQGRSKTSELLDDTEAEIRRLVDELDVALDGETAGRNADVALKLYKAAFSDEENEIMDALLERMKKDAQTMEMVQRMRLEEAETFKKMVGSTTNPELLMNLKKILQEMKSLEVLFKNPERALKMMHEDGMIPPERLQVYQSNPKMLEDDTRKSLYFSAVTICLALGLL